LAEKSTVHQYKIQVTSPETTGIGKSLFSHQRKRKEKGIYVDRINGYDDHILMLLKSEYSIAKQMQLLKGESAHWANKTNLVKNGLEWGVKYFAASVSKDKLDIVRRYIDNQQAHHQKQTFVEEYVNFLGNVGYTDVDFE
jgi:putative transposase